MINKSLYGSTPENDERDLAYPPEAEFEVDPQANSLAMLGAPSADTGEMPPSEAGPATDLAALGMMVQGAQLLDGRRPGFVPPEILMWLQSAMQTLPVLIQQSMSGIGAGSPMNGMGGMAALAPMMMSSSAPSGPPPSGPPPRQ